MTMQVWIKKEAAPQQIKYLVISGGGAKGGVIPGALEALATSGVLKDIGCIAGSSAGAINAVMCAAGVSHEEMQSISENEDFEKLLGDKHWYNPLLGIGAMYNDPSKLRSLINVRLRATVCNFLTTATMPLPPLVDSIYKKLTVEQDQPYFLTFHDLEVLVKHYPERFKNLRITAVDRDTNELKIFGTGLDDDDVPIADACMASAAIPGVIKSVIIKGREYVDGGVVDNMPTDYFNLGKASQVIDNSEILLLGYSYKKAEGDKSPLETAVWHETEEAFPATAKRMVALEILPYLTGLRGMIAGSPLTSMQTMHAEIRGRFPLRTIAIPSPVDTLEFKKGNELAPIMRECGSLTVNAWLENYGFETLNHDQKSVLDIRHFFLNVYLSCLHNSGFGLENSKKISDFVLADCALYKKYPLDQDEILISYFVDGINKLTPNNRTIAIKSFCDAINNPLLIDDWLKHKYAKAFGLEALGLDESVPCKVKFNPKSIVLEDAIMHGTVLSSAANVIAGNMKSGKDMTEEGADKATDEFAKCIFENCKTLGIVAIGEASELYIKTIGKMLYSNRPMEDINIFLEHAERSGISSDLKVLLGNISKEYCELQQRVEEKL